MKRITAVFLTFILLLGVMTGCINNKQSVNGEGNELTIFMHFWGYNVFNNDWPIFKKAEEFTGIRLRGTAVETISDSNQAFNTMLANERLPDIIHYTKGNLNKIGIEGALIPLEDLIDKHAPNIKKLFEDYPEVKRFATAVDGHIYFIPGSLSGVDDKQVPSTGWFLRKDWIDKLGLEFPTTVNGYYNVLKAFRDRDPNENGKKDEVPYFNRKAGVSALYQLFDVCDGMYAKDRKVRYGYATSEYRNAVKEIARWYKEGLIDKEIFTRGNQTREQLLSINVGGSTHDWFSSTSVFNESYKEKIKGFSFVPIAPPADINGVVKEMESRNALHGLGWGISKDNNKVNDTIKYFDFWMSPEGRKLASYGVEGVHYTEENGKIKFSDEVINYEKGAPTYLRNQGQVEFGTIGSLDAELIAMNEIGRNGFEMYRKNNWCQISFETELIKEEQDVVSAYLNDINTYAKEQEQKWITGVDSVDDKWDNYLKTLDSMHLSEVITAYQSGWERINVK